MTSQKIRWQVFPRSHLASAHQLLVIEIFEDEYPKLGTPQNHLSSNEVLSVVRPRLEFVGYQVEGDRRVKRPVLFGECGKPAKQYDVDGWHEETGSILEVEAGQAVENNRFALDLLKASSIQFARNLIMAIPANYHPERLRKSGKPPKKEFDSVLRTLDALFASNRLALPLESVLVIGY